MGAGAILVTGRQQIKGLTTAAGLWASACMGLAIGTGFYMAAVCGCLLILLTIVVLPRLERIIFSRSRNVTIYVEYENSDDMVDIISKLKSINVRIFDIEIEKARKSENKYPNALFSVQLPKGIPHTSIFTSISTIEGIRAIEEL